MLYILGQLADEDVDWLLANGHKERVPEKTELIRQGRHVDKLYIVLSGSFAIRRGGEQGKEIRRISLGEVLGELSFLDALPPVASVVALEGSTVLSVEKRALSTKLASDFHFAARFYRALGLFLADRLRAQVSLLGAGTQEEDDESANLDDIEVAGARFQFLMSRLQGM